MKSLQSNRGFSSLARTSGNKPFQPARAFSTAITALVLCSACETYEYQSKPVKMHLSPIVCSDKETEGNFRVWIKRNAIWLKEQLTETGTSQSSEQKTLQNIVPRLRSDFFTGCTASFSTSKWENRFLMDAPAIPLHTSKLSFENEPSGRLLCLEVLASAPFIGKIEQDWIENQAAPFKGASCVEID